MPTLLIRLSKTENVVNEEKHIHSLVAKYSATVILKKRHT